DSSHLPRKVLVHELHSHRPLAHGCRTPLAGAGPDVAGGEDAGHARLEQVVRPGGVAGEDEAVGIARDGIVQPFRARLRAEEEEKGRERELLAALQRDRLELPVYPVKGGDLTAVTDGDAVTVKLVDEIVG